MEAEQYFDIENDLENDLGSDLGNDVGAGAAAGAYIEEDININNARYKSYKKRILGTLIPAREDSHSEFYLLKTYDQIKIFISRIKSFSLNYKLVNEHVETITRQILLDKEIYITSPIALVEYNSYQSNEVENLIEILDGHHRIESLKNIFELDRTKRINIKSWNMEIWIQIYKTDIPDGEITKTLFKKFNNVKPFPVNKDIFDIKLIVLAKLDDIFPKTIRDSETRCNRPYIRKHNIAMEIEEQIRKQLDISNKDLGSINIDDIIERFTTLNRNLITKSLCWFNDKTKDHYYKSQLSESTYNTAIINGIMIGLVDVKYLISQCIHL